MFSEIENHNINASGDFAGRDMHKYYGVKQTRLEKLFQRLTDEVENNKKIQKTIEDIEHYKTVLDGTKGLEEKLSDGGFTTQEIANAARKKMKYAMKAEKYIFYESAQKIDALLFGEIKTSFDHYVTPLITAGADKETIGRVLHEKVIAPLIAKIENDGASDEKLCYNADDIDGMIYYLTGGCHINWKEYDL